MQALTSAIDCFAKGGLANIDAARAEALSVVTRPQAFEHIPLHSCLSRVLARILYASKNCPPFDQSAMDGYAFASADIASAAGRLKLSGQARAGATGAGTVEPGCAMRIFTGAPLPARADTVVMQEHVTQEGGFILLPKAMALGANIRKCGEDVLRGDILLEEGVRLDARHVAMLAAQGMSSIPVFRKPVVAIVSTGDELCDSDGESSPNRICDSNRPMLTALLADHGVDIIDGGKVKDSLDAISERFSQLAQIADMIISTGGVSVGDYDFSARAGAMACGKVKTLKIAMKPGKPAAIGRIGVASYLGLPGNPGAAFASWHVLGLAMMRRLCGQKQDSAQSIELPSLHAFRHKQGRTELVPGRLARTIYGLHVECLAAGSSARLGPWAAADGLVEISAHREDISAGDLVSYFPFHGTLS